MVVDDARLTHLAYAAEIAQAMLRRQQAEAVIAARRKIVTGAVTMVDMALKDLASLKVVELDDERKAAMVSNLMVVLCGEGQVTPIVDTGTWWRFAAIGFWKRAHQGAAAKKGLLAPRHRPEAESRAPCPLRGTPCLRGWPGCELDPSSPPSPLLHPRSHRTRLFPAGSRVDPCRPSLGWRRAHRRATLDARR